MYDRNQHQEKFEDITRVIRNHKSKKDRHNNGEKKRNIIIHKELHRQLKSITNCTKTRITPVVPGE